MPIIKQLSSRYLPNTTGPVGLEAAFEVHDTTAGGGAGETFVTCICIDPGNATYWTLDAASSTGLRDNAGVYTRHPANPYDPEGITATWTERISDNPAAPTRYVLRAKFDAPGGMIQVSAQTTQVSDPSNTTELVTATVPIVSPSGL